MGQQVGARHPEQRTPQPAAGVRPPGAHRGEPIDAGPAQRTQQEGFGLVVAMVGEGQDFAGAQVGRERRMACLAGRAFEAQPGAPVHGDADHLQRDAEPGAGGLAVRHPCIRLRMQAVVDVERPQSDALRRGIARQEVQQHRGIQAAAVADHAGRASLRTRGQPQLRDSRLARSIHSRWSRW